MFLLAKGHTNTMHSWGYIYPIQTLATSYNYMHFLSFTIRIHGTNLSCNCPICQISSGGKTSSSESEATTTKLLQAFLEAFADAVGGRIIKIVASLRRRLLDALVDPVVAAAGRIVVRGVVVRRPVVVVVAVVV